MRRLIYATRLLVALFILVGLSMTIPAASASTVNLQSQNEQVSVTLTITDAYYCDADLDGIEDDIIGHFDILLSGMVWYSFDLYLSLTLPSGIVYSYLYVVNTYQNALHCTMYLYDHATEAGDYTFSVQITSFTGGIVSGTAEYVFDPPGGSGNTDPCGRLLIE